MEGQNIAIEFRWTEGQDDRLPGLAAGFVRLEVNVIVAGVPASIQAATHYARDRNNPHRHFGSG